MVNRAKKRSGCKVATKIYYCYGQERLPYKEELNNIVTRGILE
jgi:hypothetical protein